MKFITNTMKTIQIKLLTIVIIAGLGLLFSNCTNRQISNYGKTDNKIPQAQNSQDIQQNKKLKVNIFNSKAGPVTYFVDSINKITKIQFINGKSFDLYENNPYNKFKYPVKSIDEEGNNTYDVQGKTLKEVLTNLDTKYLNPEYFNTNTFVDALYSNGSFHFLEDGMHVIAKYKLEAVKDLISTENSTLYIMDMYGNILYKLDNMNVGISEEGITNDLKYLYITWASGAYDNNIGGVRIYDLDTKEIIYENMIVYDYIRNVNNLIILYVSLLGDKIGSKYLDIIDIYNKKKYSRTFTNEEFDNCTIIDKNGFKIENKEGSSYLLYEKDFEKEDIK